MLRSQSLRARQRRHHRAIGFALALAAFLGTPAATAQGAAGADWRTPAGTLQGTRYSALSEIDAGNVGSLVEEFSWATERKASHQGQPLVVGPRMYVVTPYPNRLIALDLAHPGQVLWTYEPDVLEFARGVACCDVVNRGAAYASGKVVFNLLDASTVAVDAITGKQVWRTRLGNPYLGETMTGAPLIAGGKVIVGNAGGELGVRGWVQALDLATGAPLWKAFNTGPDADVKIGPRAMPFYAKDRGKDLGATSWPGTLWKQGGSTSWAWFSYDPALRLVYHGTGNPGVWNPDMRPGDNKWGASIFARHVDTGEVAWAYQLTPHDGWDYDAVNESIVVDLPIGGRLRKVVVHFDKNGFAYTIDRVTGQVLSARKFAAQVNWADRIDLATGRPVVNAGMMPREGQLSPTMCPSALGGKDFEPASYSPLTRLFYVPAINFCNRMEPLKALYIAGTPFMGVDLSLAPGAGGFLGELIAWDAANGRRAWSRPEKLALYGGSLATAGNVVFYGTLDRHFRAVDAATGRLLFDKVLECGIVGNPITFTGPDGRQRVAVYTGVGWLAGGLAGGSCPAGEEGDDDGATSSGSTDRPESGRLHVFKLP